MVEQRKKTWGEKFFFALTGRYDLNDGIPIHPMDVPRPKGHGPVQTEYDQNLEPGIAFKEEDAMPSVTSYGWAMWQDGLLHRIDRASPRGREYAALQTDAERRQYMLDRGDLYRPNPDRGPTIWECIVCGGQTGCFEPEPFVQVPRSGAGPRENMQPVPVAMPGASAAPAKVPVPTQVAMK